ncbi:MAG: YnfA family protein [Solirubrobacterales bacterium]|nr:YnfA family protein [Solirubrobacterales bacterium]
MVLRSLPLFLLAAVAEIGGAYLVWTVVKDGRAWGFALLGVLLLGAYGVIAALQPSEEFGRVLAAYGGVFVVGSLAWGVAFDGFRPDRADLGGAAVCLLGAAIIIYGR